MANLPGWRRSRGQHGIAKPTCAWEGRAGRVVKEDTQNRGQMGLASKPGAATPAL